MEPGEIDRAGRTAGAKRARPELPLSGSAAPLRTLGVDPGLNVTGYGVIERRNGRLCVVEAGVVRGRTRGSLDRRLLEIHEGLCDVIRTLSPEVMAVEELYSHYARPRTAILMGHARGVICLAAAQAGLPVVPYGATQIKRILTGSGRAPKSQVQRAIQFELSLARLPEPPDVADALAVALCHSYLKRAPRGPKVSARRDPDAA
jgi:crossover junction endodeoxyribonuclease RuvC